MYAVYFYYIATTLIWGTTWFPIKLQFGVVAPSVSIVYRFLIAAFLLLLWCVIKRLRMRFSFKEHCHFVLLGMTFFSINYVFIYAGSEYLTSGLVAVIFSLLAFFNTINAKIFFGDKIEWHVLLGSLIGVLGLCIIFWPQFMQFSVDSQANLGVSFTLGGTFFASLGCMVMAKSQRSHLPTIQTNAYGMCYGAIFLLICLYLLGAEFNFDFSMRYFFALLYLSLFGSIIAFCCYLALIGKIGPSRAAYAVVLVPIIALIVSGLFEDYVWNFTVVLGLALVLAGNVLILGNLRKQLV